MFDMYKTHHICPWRSCGGILVSPWLSVRLSVENVFRTVTPLLHFLLTILNNDDTSHMQICCSWPEEDPYLFWDIKEKGQGQICTLKFASTPSPFDTMCSLWPKEDLYYFGFKRSNVMVKYWLQTLCRFRRKFNFLFTYNDDTSDIHWSCHNEGFYWFWGQ